LSWLRSMCSAACRMLPTRTTAAPPPPSVAPCDHSPASPPPSPPPGRPAPFRAAHERLTEPVDSSVPAGFEECAHHEYWSPLDMFEYARVSLSKFARRHRSRSQFSVEQNQRIDDALPRRCAHKHCMRGTASDAPFCKHCCCQHLGCPLQRLRLFEGHRYLATPRFCADHAGDDYPPRREWEPEDEELVMAREALVLSLRPGTSFTSPPPSPEHTCAPRPAASAASPPSSSHPSRALALDTTGLRTCYFDDRR
jgi:hypothetical protein